MCHVDISYISFYQNETNDSQLDLYMVTADRSARRPSEISVEKGQLVELLSKPPGSKSWRVRQHGDVLLEGFVPSNLLHKQDSQGDIAKIGKRNSLETLNSHSSEGKLNKDSSAKTIFSCI